MKTKQVVRSIESGARKAQRQAAALAATLNKLEADWREFSHLLMVEAYQQFGVRISLESKPLLELMTALDKVDRLHPKRWR